MRKLTITSVGIVAALVALSFAPPRPAAGPGAIVEMLENLFKAIDAGDRAAARACLVGTDSRFPVQIYDLDLQHKPETIEGLEPARAYLDALFAGIKRDGVKVESKITKIHADCHSPELGYATLEFTQTFTVNGKSETSEYRATALVSYDEKTKWHLFHWHSSLAKEPAMIVKIEAADKK